MIVTNIYFFECMGSLTKITYMPMYAAIHYAGFFFLAHFVNQYIGSCSQWQKVFFFPISRIKFPIQGTKKYHHFVTSYSKLYFCIPNISMLISQLNIGFLETMFSQNICFQWYHIHKIHTKSPYHRTPVQHCYPVR